MNKLRARSLPILGLIIFLWAVEILDQSTPGQSLDRYGIIPRQLIGVRGIVLAPFLHGGFGHLLSNTLPLLGLGWLVTQTGQWLTVSLWAMLLAGLGTWLLADSSSTHIGASGLVAGYLGYLLWRSAQDKTWPQVGGWLLLVFILLIEGPGASWHSHLFGLAGGIAAGTQHSIKAPRPPGEGVGVRANPEGQQLDDP